MDKTITPYSDREFYGELSKAEWKQKMLGFSKEETQTSKEYTELGFKKQGLQEAQHAKFFKQKVVKYWK